MPESMASAFLKKLDVNNDNQISFEEFGRALGEEAAFGADGADSASMAADFQARVRMLV